MSKCLYCYKELADGEVDFHKGCCKKFFGIPEAHELPYSLDEEDKEIYKQSIASRLKRFIEERNK